MSTITPVPEARCSNMRHCPIGIGVQGLADTFMALRLLFDSPEACGLNVKIFETIYHAALEASCEMAQRDGPYETWVGSPAQQGKLQYDLSGVVPLGLGLDEEEDRNSWPSQLPRNGS